MPNIVLYDYQAGRAGQSAVDYLQGFNGYLQVDGYIGYEKTAATLVGCWAHTRRKLMEAKTAQPKGKSGKAVGYSQVPPTVQAPVRCCIQLSDS